MICHSFLTGQYKRRKVPVSRLFLQSCAKLTKYASTVENVFDTAKRSHPGGAPRLLMAAGQDLEPYWDVYRQHFRGHVVQWMEKY